MKDRQVRMLMKNKQDKLSGSSTPGDKSYGTIHGPVGIGGHPKASELREGVPALRKVGIGVGNAGLMEFIKLGGQVYSRKWDLAKKSVAPIKSAFNAVATADQTIYQGLTTRLTYASTKYNFNSDFSLANNQYVAPVEGLYSFHVQVLFRNSYSDQFVIGSRLNTGIYNLTKTVVLASQVHEAHVDYPNNIYLIGQVSTEALLNKGDIITSRVTANDTDGDMKTYQSTQDPYSFFTGHLIAT